jgi:mono/diheme cytochrome c family protein
VDLSGAKNKGAALMQVNREDRERCFCDESPIDVDCGRVERKHTGAAEKWAKGSGMRALLSMAVVVILVGALAAGAQNPPHRGDPQEGSRLALRVCGACHIVATNQEMRPLVPHYAPSFFDIANRPGTTAQSIEAFLAHPHRFGNMPSPELTAAQVADVAAYILTLRGRY